MAKELQMEGVEVMEREFITVNNIRLSYLDFGGNGVPLLILHGHFGCANMFIELAEELCTTYRVVALDQRGHGWSDLPGSYTREDYIEDIRDFMTKLNLAPAIILGHSLGGVNAYQFAARYPEMVKALIIEDIGVVINSSFTSSKSWPRRFPSMRAMRKFLVEYLMAEDTYDSYFQENAVECIDGWGFRFDCEHIAISREHLNGDWTKDWLATSCPALLLHGHKSWAVDTEQIRRMASARQHTRLVEFRQCGHTIHDQDSVGFLKAVKEFLKTL